MDKSWMQKSRLSKDYRDGVKAFLTFAFENSSYDNKILCPCLRCANVYWHTFEVVEEHLVCFGFLRGYTTWICHGESLLSSSHRSVFSHQQNTSCVQASIHNPMESIGHDDIDGLLRDALGMHNEAHGGLSPQRDGVIMQECVERFDRESVEGVEVQHSDVGHGGQPLGHDHNPEATKFYNLLQDADQEVYPGCTKYSKLSCIVHLFHLKCLNGWTGKSFTMLLEFLLDLLPDGATIPKSSYDAKRFMRGLGLSYEKIHSCPNDCMLYWGDKVDQKSCHVCGASRWLTKGNDNSFNEEVTNEGEKKQPAKILRYFPLIPRLQRLFMSSKTSSSMRWHEDGRTKDGLLRHPADSEAWKAFDSRYPNFSSDPRNVRLGLATDGFNPFRLMSSTYSTWPVILIPYNLPPWLCMKQPSFILSMIIPGEKGPGNDIDVYLQPLIEELKQLWEGVDTYDASAKQTFHMQAALLWTINDFPAYANLSGWSTKGRYACPCCAEKTSSRWLYNGGKFCYLAHRRWLNETHNFRFQKQFFDGTEELRYAPTPLTGTNVLMQTEGLNFTFGKMPCASKKKRMRDNFDKSGDKEMESRPLDGNEVADEEEVGNDPNEVDLWKKRSIFFKLPYWEYNLIRHNLDVMHIEKNVCENVIGTLLNVEGKSKDNIKARLDLVDMGIRRELHPQVLPNDRMHLPPACYSMSKNEKDLFCKVLKNIKVSDGYASNISRCVNIKERKLSSLKSHDNHILMQDLLPLALRSSMTKQVTKVLIELCNIFKAICSKVLNVQELEQLESRVAITLCHMEKIFPPSFFTIMVHLVIHLVTEARLAGPVHYRWMYPIERYLLKLKSYVRNKAHPEGSIAEGYLAEECLTFCSRYLDGVETRFNRPVRNPDVAQSESSIPFLFASSGQPIGKSDVIELETLTWAQAHRYVLFHHEAVEKFRIEYVKRLKRQARPRRLLQNEIDRSLNENFHEWFQANVLSLGDVEEEITWLARGPNKLAKRYKGFIINGFRFHTKDREMNRRTQNSGLVVTSSTRSYATARDRNPLEGDVNYFGVLTDVIELDYYGKFRVVLFRCDWADVTSGRGVIKDQFGFTVVNFSRLIHTGEHISHEPFVFSSQAKQVFYSQDPKEEGWYVVVWNTPRDLFDMGEECNADDVDARSESLPYNAQELEDNIAGPNDAPTWLRLDISGDIYAE